ncbi:MAG TPA: hypothetical protein VGT61_08385 [Thermomicrobiales bacterium]|jgi:hypothetical protein|nr:hypothetical protein [Thermomicrobiales bacterium]
MPAPLRDWWESVRTMGRGYALVNIVVGTVCIGLALLDIRLGLGTYGRWLLALPFGAVPLIWGLVALRLGGDPATARPLRIVGDIALWSLTTLFTVLALALDSPETGPLITLIAIALVTIVGAAVSRRRAA